MAADKSEGAGGNLADILQTARKRPMNIALVIGKDGLSVAADPRKPAEVMWREAKKAGGGAKGGMGVCSVSGKEMLIQFANDDVPATLLQVLKKSLREAGLKYKPIFTMADGSTVSDPDDEEAAETGAGDAAPDDPAARLQAEFDALTEKLDAAKAAAEPAVARKLDGLATMFLATVAKDPRKAAAVLVLLTDAVAAVQVSEAPVKTTGGTDRAARRLGSALDVLLAELA